MRVFSLLSEIVSRDEVDQAVEKMVVGFSSRSFTAASYVAVHALDLAVGPRMLGLPQAGDDVGEGRVSSASSRSGRI